MQGNGGSLDLTFDLVPQGHETGERLDVAIRDTSAVGPEDPPGERSELIGFGTGGTGSHCQRGVDSDPARSDGHVNIIHTSHAGGVKRLQRPGGEVGREQIGERTLPHVHDLFGRRELHPES